MIPGGIRVKRDGPRGWHTIDERHYDPAVHELYEPDAVTGDGSGTALPPISDKPKTAAPVRKGRAKP